MSVSSAGSGRAECSALAVRAQANRAARSEEIEAWPVEDAPQRKLEGSAASTTERGQEAHALESTCETSPEGELTAQVRDAALDSNFWWQTPKPIDASVEPDDKPGTAWSASISGIDVTKTIVTPGSSAAYTFSLLNSGVNADLDFTNDARDLDVSLFASPGWLELDTTALWNLAKGQLWGSTDGGSLGFVASLAAWSNFVGGGPELDYAINDRLSGHAAIFLSASANRATRYIGRYEGPIDSLAGLHRVEVEDNRGYWNSADGGLFHKLGFGAVWSWTQETTTTYRTHLSKTEAASWLKTELGLGHMSRNFRRALGLKVEERPLPDPSRPLESMRVGDELTFMVEAEHQHALFSGLRSVKLGLAAAFGSALEIGIWRLPGTEVEVSIRPVSLRQGGGYLGLSRYVGVDATRTAVRGTRRAYILDLAEPTGREALVAILDGRSPKEAREKVTCDPKLEACPSFARDEPIATGVRQTYLEEATLASTGLYAGTKFFYVMPTGQRGFLGLSVSGTRGEEQLSATDGRLILSRETNEIHTRRELLFLGNFRASTFASLREVSLATDPFASRRFAGLALRSEIAASKVCGQTESRSFVKVLNDAFGTALAPRARKGRGESREVAVERVLTQTELDALAHIRLREAAAVADATGILSAPILAMSRALSQTDDLTARAKIVSRFVGTHGMTGFGAIHRLLGGAPRDLAFETTTSAYSGPGARAEELTILETTGGTRRRPADLLREVIDLLDRVEVGLSELEDDPFMAFMRTSANPAEDSRPALASSLSNARGLLEDLADLPARGFDADTRRSLYLELPHARLGRLAHHLERARIEAHVSPSPSIADPDSGDPITQRHGLETVSIEVRAELIRRQPTFAERLEQEGLGWGRVSLAL